MTKKRSFGKMLSLALALVMMLSCVGVTQAFAMENDPADVGNSANARIATGTTYVPYATVRDDYFTESNFFRNTTDATQPNGYVFELNDVEVDDDERVHRLIFRFYFAKSFLDNGIGDVKLTVYARKENGQILQSNSISTPYVDETVNGGTKGLTNGQFFIEGVSPGETLHIWLDASTADGVTSNGNFRSIWVESGQVYCD